MQHGEQCERLTLCAIYMKVRTGGAERKTPTCDHVVPRMPLTVKLTAVGHRFLLPLRTYDFHVLVVTVVLQQYEYNSWLFITRTYRL